MDHPLPQTQFRPWRTATLVASLVALVELGILLAIALPALGHELAGEVKAAATVEAREPLTTKPGPAASEAKARKGPVLRRGETSVLVLNGNGVAGAASTAAAQVRGLGYVVASYGNAPRSDYRRTLVMHRKGREAEARRLARDIGGAVVAPLDGVKPRELMGAQLAIVLGER